MKTIKDIREKLKMADEWESWMEELHQDERKSVQTLLNQWNKKKRLADGLISNHQSKMEFDKSFKEHPESLVAGIDEAGRGPLAGPVVTAAVILPEDCSLLVGLDDSKKLSKEKREAFAELIRELAISYSVHVQSPEEIDRQNIYRATKTSMTEAAMSLDPQPSVILADAMKLEVPIPCESIIKGDAKSLAIAAASILAKTGRDAIMDAYAETYPVYGFAKHAGYGTPEHVEALRKYGPCPIHRKTFEPVKSLLQESR
ncbi:ribonuclease HII [Planococcus sp. N028]|uniref:Ribonuclease HII n=1 Tax=Planococcus shixiaomingii TaxID=3058393 RepID=A0ABT8N129_9BACL|nr:MULTISPECIES: ribonuclease HII [unclassified Planococcus (in: firmicutes)]MDN7241265.1 ribonuclease HII [Planococcus sp. N028]WKA53525.1 ribonuclease HII [Planococcus sp. N022]